MGHNVTALILKGPYSRIRAEPFDLVGFPLGDPALELTLFHFNHYFSACWQSHFNSVGELPVPEKIPSWLLVPRERVLSLLMQKISEQENPRFMIMVTFYHGGAGDQFGCAYQNESPLPGPCTVSASLEHLGVVPDSGLDAFDTVGLQYIRSMPDGVAHRFDRYDDWSDELDI